MQFIPEKEIVVSPTRQRKEFEPEALASLMDSISKVGLLQPVILRNGKDLVAGERRLRAIKDLWNTGASLRYGGVAVPEGMIPCVDLGELDELAREEAEYDENTKRADLTWQERAAAAALLESIRTRQATLAGLPPPTTATLAEEIRGYSGGRAFDETKRDILIAQHLNDPEVKAAASPDEAFKVLKRKDAAKRNIALAASVGATFTADSHQAIHHHDSVVWLAGQPADTYDVTLTDPPYGMGADEFGDSGGMTPGAHGYADDYGSWKVLIRGLAPELFRVAKPAAHAYIFCDMDRFHELRQVMGDAGWTCFRTPLIWYKPGAVRAPWPEHGPQRKYELILYAMKGKRTVTRLYPDVLTYAPDTNLGHAAQKPVALFVDLLRRSVLPGDVVLDPCMGSGTIFPAAHELKCRAVGVDKDASSYGLAIKRLEQLKAQKELGL